VVALRDPGRTDADLFTVLMSDALFWMPSTFGNGEAPMAARLLGSPPPEFAVLSDQIRKSWTSFAALTWTVVDVNRAVEAFLGRVAG